MENKNGIALILLILVIVLVIIVVAGLTAFVFESLRISTFKEQELKTVYLAQAGIMSAIVDYRNGNSWTKQTNVNVAGIQYYHVGKDANFLLLNASNPQRLGTILRRVPFANENQSSTIRVTRMTVEWNFGGQINRIVLGGAQRWNGPAMSSPANISDAAFTDFVMAANTNYSGTNANTWRFNINVPASATIITTFYFSDGSQRKGYLLKGGAIGNREFSITATGEVRGNATWRRTIEATYDTGTSRITSWQERSNHIIP